MTNPADFKKLQEKWYAKLKKSGFEDIEQDEEYLKVWHSRYYTDQKRSKKGIASFQDQERYYQLASQFLHEYTFESVSDRLIWELHASGISIRSIVTELKKKKIKAYKFLVHTTIVRLAKIMGKQCQSQKKT